MTTEGGASARRNIEFRATEIGVTPARTGVVTGHDRTKPDTSATRAGMTQKGVAKFGGQTISQFDSTPPDTTTGVTPVLACPGRMAGVTGAHLSARREFAAEVRMSVWESHASVLRATELRFVASPDSCQSS